MPIYAIHCIDKPMQQALRASTREAHLAYVRERMDQLLVAGPLLDEAGEPIGSMLLIEFPDYRSAVTFAANDPYARAGLFASIAVTAWRQVLPPREENQAG
ncbi:YciI family protein [Thermaurantiacus sp.]